MLFFGERANIFSNPSAGTIYRFVAGSLGWIEKTKKLAFFFVGAEFFCCDKGERGDAHACVHETLGDAFRRIFERHFIKEGRASLHEEYK